MKKKCFLWALTLLLAIPLHAQSWKTGEITKFITKYSNSAGTKTVYISGKSENYTLTCMDDKTGTQLWQKPLSYDGVGLEFNFCFTNDSTIYAADSNSHIFINAYNGKVISSIKSAFKEWYNIFLRGVNVGELASRPIKDSTYIIYFGRGGMQIIDLIEQKECYKTSGMVGPLTIMKQDDNLLLKSKEEFVYVFNTATRKMIYQESYALLQPNSRFKINSVVYKNTGLFICEDDVKMVDLTTKKFTKIVKDPTDYEFSTPLISDSTLLYCISDEGAQIIYDVTDQTKLAEIKEGTLPGLIENAKLSADKRFVTVFVYDNEENTTTVAQIECLTGIVKWKKTLFKYPSSYSVNNVNPSATSNFFTSLGSMVLANVINNLTGSGHRSGIRVSIGNNRTETTMEINKDIEFNKMFKGIQSCPAYARLVDYTKDNISIACIGALTPLIKDEKNEEEGEFIVTLNQTDGSLVSFNKIVVNPEPIENNSITEKNFKIMKLGMILLGKNDIYLFKNNELKDYNFGKNEVKLIGVKDEFVFVSSQKDKDENFNFWRMDFSKPDSERKLIAQIYEKGYIDYSKFTDFNNTIYLTEDDIMLLPMRTEPVGEKENVTPIWKKSLKEFDFSYFLEFEQDTAFFAQGLSFYKNNIIVASKNCISGVKFDGSCVWKEEWSMDPEEISIPISYLGNNLVFATKKMGVIVNMDCKNTKVFNDFYGNYPSFFEINKSKKGVYRFDDDELFFYNLSN